jgi:hypothetical protein
LRHFRTGQGDTSRGLKNIEVPQTGHLKELCTQAIPPKKVAAAAKSSGAAIMTLLLA